jgi:hypothetical protein
LANWLQKSTHLSIYSKIANSCKVKLWTGIWNVSDAKRLKELETKNARLKRLLAEAMLENEVTKEALRKKW